MSDSSTNSFTKAEARRCGALCDRCAFSKIHNAGMVGPEFARGTSKAVIVGEAPGLEETENDQPFVGKSGQLLMKALRASGVTRSQVTITNAVACRPPGNRMDTVKVKLRKWNKLLEQAGKPPLLSPVAACRPRLLNDIRKSRTNNIVTVGGTALEGVTGVRQSILNIRGAPLAPLVDHPDFKIYPTLHPAFVLRMLRWRHVFQKDVARAFRWFEGRLGWKEPVTYFKPSFEQVDRFLSSKQKFFVVDTETDAKYPLSTRVRCVGISNEDVAIVIPLLSIDGITKFYSRAEEAKIRERLTQFFVDSTKLKVAHNAYYDKLVLWKAFGVFMAPILDTILLHRSVESEMPHSLGYVGSVFTDIDRAWKSEHTAVNAKSDRELWNYNALDVIITGRVVEPLKLLVAQRKQADVVRLDHEMQQVCADMHINGLRVDMKARDVWDKKLLHDAVLYRKILREAIGRENFNPASVFQIRDLLFGDWELPVINETKAGDPSTDDDAIRALMLEPGLRKEQRRFLAALRMFRRRAKLRGTYIVKLMPKGRSYVLDDLTLEDIEDDLSEDDYKDFREKDRKKEGIIDRDGRLRPGWNVHTPNTGRFSSGDPWNAQNCPRKLRNIIIPEDGHTFVYADKDQLELRLIVTFSKAQTYLKVFAENGDPHSTSTLMVMGEAGKKIYEKAVAKFGDAKTARKKDEDWERACDFGKRFTYAAGYGATIETIMEVLRSAEDKDENLLYANLNIAETQRAYDNWMNAAPEIAKWWDAEIELYRKQGFLEDRMTGRRCDFMDGEDRNQIPNYECQGTGSGIVNTETKRVVAKFPRWKFGRYTGVIQQGHDALMLEAPLNKAEWTRDLLNTSMRSKLPDPKYADMEFTASAKIIKHWGEA